MKNESNERQFQRLSHIRLVAIPAESWHLLRFPRYQRMQTASRIRDIAQGITKGYCPAPIILYESPEDGTYRIVDGGHRYLAFRKVYEEQGRAPAMPALIYDRKAVTDGCDESVIFVNENNKLRMDPTAIIRADCSRRVSFRLRELGDDKEGPFPGCRDLADYPIRPLSIVKAALILAVEPGKEIDHNRLAYLSVNRALDALDARLNYDASQFWSRVVTPFLKAEVGLWGREGRHLVNFGVIGFALFLAKNRERFFTKDGGLLIKTARTHVSQKRGCIEYESEDRSDFAKLKALKDAWEKPGSRLHVEAPRDPLAVAWQINDWFWKNRPKSVRVWRPELTW